jgi:NAD(P)H dehydrogenase (quinone)
MNALIVRAHHEPKSFCSALAHQAAKTLASLGHKIAISDLYVSGFDPVSDRRNFLAVNNPEYLKQQAEEAFASKFNGFVPTLENEMRKLEDADLLIFVFPMWWFGMPAILKGWVDRVFASGRIYGGTKLYENGLGHAQKRGLIIMTTGGGPDVYGGYGPNPSLSNILAPIQHGVFWFVGFLPLDPFIAWSPARISQEERLQYLLELDRRLRNLDGERPRVLPPLSDFPNFGKDSKKRFMVTASMGGPFSESSTALMLEEIKYVADLKRRGLVLADYLGVPTVLSWREFLVFREASEEAVMSHIQSLPMAPLLKFEVKELLQE